MEPSFPPFHPKTLTQLSASSENFLEKQGLGALGFDFDSDRGRIYGGFWAVEVKDRIQKSKVLPAIFKQNSKITGMDQ